jgi:DNA-binding IclR family transcriptional regulator
MIQSVERAAAILAVLGSGTPRLGVTEIAERVGLAKPTVHGLLRSLVANDLVEQDAVSGKYSLGPGVLQLGNAYLDGSELRARSLLWAESLAQRANEAVWVATLSGTRVIVLHHVFRPDNTVQILEVGAAIPWHACALGHSIVAYLPAGEAARLMAQERAALTGRTKTTRSAGAATPSRTKRQRWATPGSRRRSSAGRAPWRVRSASSVRPSGSSSTPPRTSWSAPSWTPPAPSPATWGRAAAARCCPRCADLFIRAPS